MHHIIILIVCVVILLASLLFEANENSLYIFGFQWPLHCMLYRILNIKCALCGLSRSFCSLGHGKFTASLEFHPIGPAVFTFMCLQIPYRIYAIKVGPEKVNKKIIKINIFMSIILVIAILFHWMFYLKGRIL